jgi:hypothetical protein
MPFQNHRNSFWRSCRNAETVCAEDKLFDTLGKHRPTAVSERLQSRELVFQELHPRGVRKLPSIHAQDLHAGGPQHHAIQEYSGQTGLPRNPVYLNRLYIRLLPCPRNNQTNPHNNTGIL